MSLLTKITKFVPKHLSRSYYGRSRIGNRDIVGFGVNGNSNYKDDVMWPYPAIRFKENTTDICVSITHSLREDRHFRALREKERGDWKQLCCEEKKALYRASFCQTFVEFLHPTGEWKYVLGWVLFCISIGPWGLMFFHHYVYEPLPKSFCKESQKAQLRRMLELRVNPIDGISSKWDYDNDRWLVYGSQWKLMLNMLRMALE